MAKKQDKGRFNSQRKTEAVLRILTGEALDALSREYGVTAAKPSEWKAHFVQGGQAQLKSREADARDEENARLKALVGDLTMHLELQREVNRKLEEKNACKRSAYSAAVIASSDGAERVARYAASASVR